MLAYSDSCFERRLFKILSHKNFILFLQCQLHPSKIDTVLSGNTLYSIWETSMTKRYSARMLRERWGEQLGPKCSPVRWDCIPTHSQVYIVLSFPVPSRKCFGRHLSLGFLKTVKFMELEILIKSLPQDFLFLLLL